MNRTPGLFHSILAGLPKARQKLAVFFNTYFDDSGSDIASKVIAVGGCINYADTWDSFSEQWQARLDSWGLSYFHMADWEALQGDYKTWSKPLAERRLRELLDIIYKHGIATFGLAVSHKEFDDVIAEYPQAKRRCGGPYGYLGHQCIRQVHSRWGEWFTTHENAGDVDYVSYFFEAGTPGYGKIEEAWRRERETVRWHDVIIARLDKKISPPLQVADIVAYELRELYPMSAGWVSKGGHRYPSQQLRRWDNGWYFSTGTALRDDLRRLHGCIPDAIGVVESAAWDKTSPQTLAYGRSSGTSRRGFRP